MKSATEPQEFLNPHNYSWAWYVPDSNMVGMLRWSITGNILDANDRFLEMIGYTRDELLAGCIRWLEMTPPEYMEQERAAHAELFESGVCQPFEKEYIRKDGSRFPILIGGAFFPNSRTEGVSFVIDISDRKQVEHELEHSLMMLRSTLDSTEDGIMVKDHSGKIVLYNRQFLEMWGIPESALASGDDTAPVLHAAQLLKNSDYFRTSVSALHQSDSESIDELELKDGRVFQRHSKPQWIGQKKAGRVYSFRDITEKRRTDRFQKFLTNASLLLNQNLDLNLTLRGITEIVTPEFADGCFVVARESAESAFRQESHHVDPERLRGFREYIDRYPPSATRAWSPLASVLRGEALFMPEVDPGLTGRYKMPADAERHIQAILPRSAIILPLSGRTEVQGFLMLVQDVSGRRFDDRDLFLTEELARRASLAIDNAILYEGSKQALQMRDEFISIASHELKTPLTSMSLSLQLLRRTLKDTADARTAELLKSCEDQAFQMASLVNELLDLTRIQLGRLDLHLEEVDLRDVIDSVLSRFKGDFTQLRIEVQTEISEGLHTRGFWDRTRIEQVVTNLVSNAIKYGGRKPIRIALQSNPPFITVCVHDKGIGIPPTLLPRIFDRFERGPSERRISGLGLGLYIARQIVETHGGRIWAESQLDKGTCFKVDLPTQSALS